MVRFKHSFALRGTLLKCNYCVNQGLPITELNPVLAASGLNVGVIILPTRYFTIEVVPEHKPNLKGFKLNSKELTKSILNCVQELHGDFGVAAVTSGFKAKYCNPMTRLGVIRARHGPHRLVASSLPIVKGIKNQAITLRTLYTGASLRQCFKFAVKYQKQQLMKIWSTLPNDEIRAAVKKSILDLSVFQELESNMVVPSEFSGDRSTAQRK